MTRLKRRKINSGWDKTSTFIEWTNTLVKHHWCKVRNLLPVEWNRKKNCFSIWFALIDDMISWVEWIFLVFFLVQWKWRYRFGYIYRFVGVYYLPIRWKWRPCAANSVKGKLIKAARKLTHLLVNECCHFVCFFCQRHSELSVLFPSSSLFSFVRP